MSEWEKVGKRGEGENFKMENHIPIFHPMLSYAYQQIASEQHYPAVPMAKPAVQRCMR